MNPQISFSGEDIKDNLSTPKFQKNQSGYSLEKEENTLDTLKQQIEKAYNDKDTFNNDNINGSKNEKNILLNSLLNNNSNLDLNNLYMSQISFDEKSSNFLNKKEKNENNNGLINEQEEINEKNNNKYNINIDNKIDEEENEENNNEIKYINKSNSEDKNEDSNFDYELPLGSDDNPEFFNMMSFPENKEEKNDKNKKKLEINIEGFISTNDEKESKAENNIINLTPQKKDKNKMNRNLNSAKFDLKENKILKEKESQNKEDNCLEPKCNTSNKKINKIIKSLALIEENKTHQNGFYTERNKNNNQIIKLNTFSETLKNTFFTSKEKIIDEAYNNDKIQTKPFINDNPPEIKDKEDDKENRTQKNWIESNIIKDITLSYYNKRNKRNRNSVNFTERNNNFLDISKTKIIYEKKLSNNETRSFSITQKGNHSHSHSRNYKELNDNVSNEIIPYTNYLMKKKFKNSVILLTRNKNRNILFNNSINRNNSLKNYNLSEYINFSQRNSLNKNYLEGKTEKNSPFQKSKINDSFINKNSSYKNYIFNKYKQMVQNNTMKNIGSKTFNEYSNFDNMEDIKKEKYIKDKISIDQNNNNNNTYYMNFKNNGYLTQRNKNNCPINIYSKKLINIPCGNNKNENNKNKLNLCKNKTLRKKEINNSYIIPKEKNIKIFLNEKNLKNNGNSNKNNKKFNECFKEIISNINSNKSLMNPKSNLNRNQKEKNKKKLFHLSNIDMNTIITKAIPTPSKKQEFSSKFIINKINNNKLRNNNYIKNSNNKNNNNKIHFTQSRKNLIEKYKNNILNYTINRNNKNNQVKNEVSIFIGDNKTKNKKNFNEKKNKVNNRNSTRMDQFAKNKKTIINVNQYYSSYFIKK